MKDETWDRSYTETRDRSMFKVFIYENPADDYSFIVSLQINNVVVFEHFYNKKAFPNVDNFYRREVGRIHTGYYDSRIIKKEA